MRVAISLVGSEYYGLDFLKEYILVEDGVSNYGVQLQNGVVKTLPSELFAKQPIRPREIVNIGTLQRNEDGDVTKIKLTREGSEGRLYNIGYWEEFNAFRREIRKLSARGFQIHIDGWSGRDWERH